MCGTLGLETESADIFGRITSRAHKLLIFVVDSNDRERIDEANEELSELLSHDDLKEAVLLVLANKQDIPNAMTTIEVSNKLGLPKIQNRIWYIQGTCATNGEGLYESLNWLSKAIVKGGKTVGTLSDFILEGYTKYLLIEKLD